MPLTQTIQFGVDLPNFGAFGDPLVLATLAKEAEEAGWDGFFVWDHVARPTDHDVADPWIALAAIAMNTSRVRIGTLVTPLPRRRPWKVARETASLDRLSKGRLIFGVGLGSGRPVEWEHFGEELDPKVRAVMLDEGLDILTGLWRGEPFHYDGQCYTVKNSKFTPVPVQQPRIPIWIAGAWPHKAPFRRMARWDGMCPVLLDEMHPVLSEQDRLLHIQEAIDYTLAQRQDTTPFDIVFLTGPVSRDRELFADLVSQAAAMGVTWWIERIDPPYFGADWGDPWDVEAMHAHIQKGVPK